MLWELKGERVNAGPITDKYSQLSLPYDIRNEELFMKRGNKNKNVSGFITRM